MKDWCMRHPFLTFLIIDEICATLTYILPLKDKKESAVNRVAMYCKTKSEEIINHEEESETKVIGFVKR